MNLEGFTDVSGLLRSGVYALCKRGVVIYVGKSKSLYARIYAHKHFANRAAKGRTIPDWLPAKGFVFDQVFIRPAPLEDLDALEREMINLYKPRYNESLKHHGKVSIPAGFSIGGVPLGLRHQLRNESLPRPQIGGGFRR
jgi:GIY-YIG catalytic domain